MGRGFRYLWSDEQKAMKAKLGLTPAAATLPDLKEIGRVVGIHPASKTKTAIICDMVYADGTRGEGAFIDKEYLVPCPPELLHLLPPVAP